MIEHRCAPLLKFLAARPSAFGGDTGTPLAFAGATATIKGLRRQIAPIAAKGRLYVASDGAVTAFKLP